MAQTTAILFFARSARSECNHKQLDGSVSYANNFILLQRLRAGTIHKIHESGLPFFEIDESKQKGRTFGEKLDEAISGCFEEGYSNLIVIGNDCPDLTVEDIHFTAEQLLNGKTILGPDERGGLYLIGINKSNYHLLDFQSLPWCTRNLMSAFEEKLNSLSLLAVNLEYQLDLNEKNDFKKIRNKGFLSFLKTILFKVFHFLNCVFAKIQKIFSAQNKSIFQFRGPPVTAIS